MAEMFLFATGIENSSPTIDHGRVRVDEMESCGHYQRYKIPVMHTETNFTQGPNGSEAVDWLWKEWANVLRVRNDGIPIVGFTWYSLTDQVDWDTALREKNLRLNPLGLYDLNRELRPVGKAFQKLIADWRAVLPTQSVCLRVPIMPPD
jgi:beta-glucosidase